MITEEKIWSYLDGVLIEEERKDVEQAIARDKQAAALFEEISALHNSLKAETLMQPSLLFTNRVMSAIEMAPVYLPSAQISVKTMALFAFPTLAVMAVFAALLIKNHIPITIQLPAIDFSRYSLLFIVADVLLLAYIIDMLPAKKRADLA